MARICRMPAKPTGAGEMNKANDTGRKIALFGIFRSGTNFTRTVLEWNFQCTLVTDEFAWKHGFYPVITNRSALKYPDIDVIFVTKNPFSAIASLFKYRTENGRNIIAPGGWKQFLRQRFVIYDFFQEGSPQYRFSNVVDFWNNMNWNYYSVRRPGITRVHVRYEDMLENPVTQAKRIAGDLRLDASFTNEAGFRVPDNVTRNMGDRERKTDSDYVTDRQFSHSRYREKEYMRQFDANDIEFVIHNLDFPLVKELGYAPEIEQAGVLMKGKEGPPPG